MFDYVEFCAEYSPYSHTTLDNLGRAVELFDDLGAMIKIEQESRAHTAVRAVGAGFQSVLFADVRSVEEVRHCVKHVRSERPHSGGLQGVNLFRSCLTEAGSEAWATAMDEIVIALMIEKKEAVENFDDIINVPGVDMVQFGRADFANSIGLTGQFRHPNVLEAERFVVKKAMNLGIAVRVELNNHDEIERLQNDGVRHFSVGMDVRTLLNWYRNEGASARRILDSKRLETLQYDSAADYLSLPFRPSN